MAQDTDTMLEFRQDHEILDDLGKRFRNTRIVKKLTQKDIAEKAGISLDTIKRLERNGYVSLGNLVKICRVLDLIQTIDALFPAAEFSPKDAFYQNKMSKRVRHRKTTKREP